MKAPMNTFNSLNASADDASLLTLAVAAVQSAGLAVLRPALSGARPAAQWAGDEGGSGLLPRITARLPRADLAAFILRSAGSGALIGQAPLVFS